MTTHEKDEIIRELLNTIKGLREKNESLEEENKGLKEKDEFPKPTRIMGGRTFVRRSENVPGVIQKDNNPL